MKLTVKQNINKESVVLKHKIALETATLLEGRDKLLQTDHMIYVMVSLVDNFIEESLIALINEDTKEFAEIVERDVEPVFCELIKDKEIEALFYEVLDYINEFKYREETRRTSAIGFVDYLFEIIGEYEWNDLKFFFQHISDKARQVLTDEEESKKAEPKRVTRDEFEGADAKMKELIQKFQREGQELKNKNNG